MIVSNFPSPSQEGLGPVVAFRIRPLMSSMIFFASARPGSILSVRVR